eukprot:621569-Pyramimonas_sp.AAC.1
MVGVRGHAGFCLRDRGCVRSTAGAGEGRSAEEVQRGRAPTAHPIIPSLLNAIRCRVPPAAEPRELRTCNCTPWRLS